MNWKDEQVKKIADMVKAEMVRSKLFGEPIDVENAEQVIVFAYLLGENKQINKNLKELELI